jgi:hypothetical protein
MGGLKPVPVARRALLLVVAAASLSAQILLEHATVIDATGSAPRRNLSVLVESGRITRIAAEIPKPKNAIVADVKGKYVIPGLWDMHVHIGATPEKFFPLLQAAGITGVREMYSGVPAAVIAQWRANPPRNPDAPWIVAPGFVDGPLLAAGGFPPPGAVAVATPEQARQAVRILAQTGADFLKVYNSLPREAFFALAQEARAIGIPFAGHVPEEVSPLEAAQAGQRSQEHLINILAACSTRENEIRSERVAIMRDPAVGVFERARLLGFPKPESLFDTYDEAKCAALFRAFVANGTWHTPTLALLKGFAYGDDLVRDPRAARMPEEWRAAPHPRDKSYMRDLAPDQFQEFELRARALLVRYKKLAGDMHRAGVRFLAGTDVNMANPVLIGFGLHDELELLVESGFTPLEALQTATRNPAEYLGHLQEIGTVEPGKIADLVVLDGDPLKDIRNVGKIHAVVWHGKYLDRAQLDLREGRPIRAAVRSR